MRCRLTARKMAGGVSTGRPHVSTIRQYYQYYYSVLRVTYTPEYYRYEVLRTVYGDPVYTQESSTNTVL